MFKKIRGYFRYRKIIEDNYFILNQRYKLKYDKIYGRLYTVISIPERRQEVLRDYKVPTNLRNPAETDVNVYRNAEVNSYISALSEYFYSIGLFELVSVSKKDIVDDVNVLIVLRYKYKNHQLILYIILSLILLILSVTLITGIYKLLFILINFIMSI